jgi:hypothetical protein
MNTPNKGLSKPRNGLVVAVDFDGTVVSHEFPKIGRDVGAVPVLKRLVDEGARIILYTMRVHEKLEEAERWYKARGIPLFGVNHNPDREPWMTGPKVYAHVYIDDAALGCPLCPGLPGEKPYVDWVRVQRMFWPEEDS